MTEESSTTAHLSVAMTMKEDDETPTVGGNSLASVIFYFQCAVVVIGVVGTAANALIIYALVASKQHAKHILIVNQNALDLFSSVSLVVTYAARLCNIQLSGASGYWVCITLLSGIFVWWGLVGSVVNLAMITIDRYLKIVHHAWSQNHLRPWKLKFAIGFAWFAGIVSNTPYMLETTGVINGVCYRFALFKSHAALVFAMVWYIVAYYVAMLIIFIYCYGCILATIRRQARVMASHGTAPSSASQTQSHKIQTNVIKTMILVSVFYAIAWMPVYCCYVYVIAESISVPAGFWYASVFVSFLYTSANPFIYATKFDPVRRVLRRMIPFKKTPLQASVYPLSYMG